MFQAGKAAEVTRKMENYRILLLGLCETRWKLSGQLQLLSGQTILFSDHEDECTPHPESVAIILSKEAQRQFVSGETVSPRIVAASSPQKIRTSNVNITVIVP